VIVALNPTACTSFIPADVKSATETFNVFTAEQLETRVQSSDAYMLTALKQTNMQAAAFRPTSLGDLERLSPEPFLLFLEPPSINERIVNQSALFSIMSKPDATLDQWIVKHPECARRIVIPHELKSEIRDKLDQTNLTERILFPGVEGTAAFLTRYYTYRPKLGE